MDLLAALAAAAGAALGLTSVEFDCRDADGDAVAVWARAEDPPLGVRLRCTAAMMRDAGGSKCGLRDMRCCRCWCGCDSGTWFRASRPAFVVGAAVVSESAVRCDGARREWIEERMLPLVGSTRAAAGGNDGDSGRGKVVTDTASPRRHTYTHKHTLLR